MDDGTVISLPLAIILPPCESAVISAPKRRLQSSHFNRLRLSESLEEFERRVRLIGDQSPFANASLEQSTDGEDVMSIRQSKFTSRTAGSLGALLLALPSFAASAGPKFTSWSEPVHLGAIVNSSSQDFSPQLSPDGLSLYFCSDRPDGFGEFDIWVSRRDCESCPWEAPVPLGPNINSTGTEISSAFSPDGHLLFFASDRGPGGFGDVDIWVSFREDRYDDFGWGPPVNLGPDVNTDIEEVDPAFLPGRGLFSGHTLYFVRSGDEQDIFQTSITRMGIPIGSAVPVTEINSVGRLDGSPNLRSDGLEVVFWSNRTGGLGGADVWSATRPHARAPWSPPVNLGATVNTNFAEITLGMSIDGTQLFVAKGQQLGGLGLRDLWVSTRERIDEDKPEDYDD